MPGRPYPFLYTVRSSYVVYFIIIQICFSLVSVTVINTIAKNILGKEKVSLAHRLQSILQGIPRRNLEAGTEAEAVEEHSLNLLSLLSYTAWDHLPRDGTTHSGHN